MVCARAASAARGSRSGSSEPSTHGAHARLLEAAAEARRLLHRLGRLEDAEHDDGVQAERGEEAQVERDRFAGVARDVGVDGDGGEALGLAGAKERQVEVGLAARADRLEEAQDDVGRLHRQRASAASTAANVSRARSRSAMGTNSSGACACAMSPGP